MYSTREKKVENEPKNYQLDLVGKHRNEEILIKRKKARFLEIFTLLNPCGSDKIYSEVINTQKLDPEITKIILPLLQELEETGERLDFEEFFDSMENLCKFLTPEERYSLLKEKAKYEPRSEKRKRGSSSAGKIYSRNVKFKEEAHAKVVAERIKKDDEELKQCTFHPKIKVYRREKLAACNVWDYV